MSSLLRSDEGARALRPRAGIAAAIGGVLLLACAVQLYRLQVLLGGVYEERSRANFIKELVVPADRGSILDRRGRVLVDNRASFEVLLTPAFCQPCGEVIRRLAKYLSLPPEEVARVRAAARAASGLERFRGFKVKVDIGRDELDLILAHKERLAGVDVEGVPHRNYKVSPDFSHVVGYLSEATPGELKRHPRWRRGDYVGRRGLEQEFERWLRGTDGRQRVVVDARGDRLGESADRAFIPKGRRFVAPVAGDNLVLSIDQRLQQTAERHFPGRAGAVVAVEVETGFLLAVVSRPGYDPNQLTGRISRAELQAISADPLQPLIFKVDQQQYHPGSTMKPIVALAGLEEGVLHPGTRVTCRGGLRFGGRFWRCWRKQGHGTLDLRNAIIHSCDTYFYTAGARLGLDRIARWGLLLGLGAPTGLGLGPEAPGVMPTEDWYRRHVPGGYVPGAALNAAIGQGAVNVTPLQLAMAYAAIANGGTLYRPQIVRRIERPDGSVVKAFGPVAVRQIGADPSTIAFLHDALAGVVNTPGGTAWRSRLPDVVMAGKTGTAQVVAMGKTVKHEEELSYWQRDHAWFASFAPAGDPQIAVVVLNEHGGEGAQGSAPTAAAVIEKYFQLQREDQGRGVEVPGAPAVDGGRPRARPVSLGQGEVGGAAPAP